MAALSVLRARVYDRLRESSSDSHFTDAQINSFLNEAQDYVAALGSAPEKNNVSSPITTTLNTGDYTNPSDDLVIQSAYFGTTANSNDIKRLKIVTTKIIGDLLPNWLDATVSNAGQPLYLFRKDLNTITIAPRPDSTYAGKNIYLFYGNVPLDMSADSDTPNIALSYHNILPFFACRLAYYALSNSDMALEMMAAFLKDYKSIQQNVDKESEETFVFKWGISER